MDEETARIIGRMQRELEALRAIEIPANATATPTASKIPIADANAKLNGWVSRWIYASDADWVGTQYQPLTSTSWDGDSFSTTAKTLIDLSAVFGVPAGVKAVLMKVSGRDSASATTNCLVVLSPNNTSYVGPNISLQGVPNDVIKNDELTVPCNADGDIYYQTLASGASTLDVWLEVWGYYI